MSKTVRPQKQKSSKVRFVQELRFGNAATPHGNNKYDRKVKHRPLDPEDWEEWYENL